MVNPFGDPNHERPMSKEHLEEKKRRLEKERPPTNIPKPYDIMRPPLPRGWWDDLPQPGPHDPSPYAPVPYIPPIMLPPREVDPPSRPPEWFGPKRLIEIPGRPTAPGPEPRGLPALLAEIGAFDASTHAPPDAGRPGRFPQYLRNSRGRGY